MQFDSFSCERFIRNYDLAFFINPISIKTPLSILNVLIIVPIREIIISWNNGCTVRNTH